LISVIAQQSDPQTTLRCAVSLLERLFAEPRPPERVTGPLLNVLTSLTGMGVSPTPWLDRIADLARTLRGVERSNIVTWLNENA